jgi:hypothetical protein
MQHGPERAWRLSKVERLVDQARVQDRPERSTQPQRLISLEHIHNIANSPFIWLALPSALRLTSPVAVPTA